MEKFNSYTNKDRGKFYKLGFILSLLVLIILLLNLYGSRQAENQRMVFATNRYMESLQVYSAKAKIYLGDPNDEDLLLFLNKLSSDMGTFMEIASFGKNSKYKDLNSDLLRLAKLNFEISFVYFPKADNEEIASKIQNLIKSYEDLYDYYKNSESGVLGEYAFNNYASLVEKVEKLNENIIKDFAITDSCFGGN